MLPDFDRFSEFRAAPTWSDTLQGVASWLVICATLVMVLTLAGTPMLS